MKKRVMLIFAMLLFAICTLQPFLFNTVQALPGPPMIVYGVINETGGGKNIAAGISVDAYVIDAINGNEWFNYTTGVNDTLDLSGYGYKYTGVEFRINDTDPPVRQGNDVYFYINHELVDSFSFNAGTVERNYSLTDIPEILYVNSSDYGFAGRSYVVNVTATDLFDIPSEMGVKVNWSHGSLSANTSLSAIGGDEFNGSFTLDESLNDLVYTVWVNDSAGNLNSSGPYTITVNDSTAPSSNVETIDDYWLKSSNNPLVIAGTASDNIALKNVTLYYYHSSDNSSFSGPFAFDVNGSPWVGVSWSFTFPNGTGYYRFYSIAVDNASISESVPVSNDTMCGYDTSNPSSTISYPVDGNYYRNSDLIDSNISGTSVDVLSGIDHVNITIYNSTEGTYWTGISWQTGVAWMETNGTTNWYNDSAIPSWTTGNTYIINSTAVDKAGNIESNPDSNSFTYDTTEPSTTIILPADNSYNKSGDTIDTNITGTASDTTSGVDHVNITIYNSTNGKYWTGSDWQEGVAWLNTNGTTSWYNDSAIPSWTSGNTYIVNSTAIDTAGNIESTPDSNSFTYDTAEPSTTITLPEDGAYYKSGDAIDTNITGTASDAVSNIDHVNITIYNSSDARYWTGSEWQESVAWMETNGTTSWYNDSNLPTWTTGNTYIVNSSATDIAGNIESTDSNSFTYDTVDPTAPTYNTAEDQSFSSNPTLDIDFADAIALQTVEYKVDSGGTYSTIATSIAGTTYTSNWQIETSDWNTMTNGTHYLYFRITDDAGNQYETGSNESGFKINKNMTLPSSEITVPANNSFYNSEDVINSNISGVATNGVYVVDHVNITIYNSSDGRYWNGTAWQTGVAWLNTNGTTTWYNDSGIPSWVSGKNYTVNSTAVDTEGNIDETPDSNSFRFDTVVPESVIVAPSDGAELDTLSNITGTASDSISGIDHVNITIFNSTNGKYWNGTGWQPEVAWLNTNGTTSWYNDSGIPSWVNGKTYLVNSTAVDSAGNIESSADSNSFTYDTTDDDDDDDSGSGGSPGGGFAPAGDLTDPSAPENVTCLSVIVDTTPSFMWSAATDNEEVLGYHVKIDDGAEESIGNVTRWTSEALTNGSYVFYVRAEDSSGNLGPYGNCSFVINTSNSSSMMPVADGGGPYSDSLVNSTVMFDGSKSIDPDGEIVNYSWDFGNGEVGYGSVVSHRYLVSGVYNITLMVTDEDGLSDTDSTKIVILADSDGDGWSDEIEESYGVDKNSSLEMPLDTDGDGVPDEDSTDGKYTGDADDDNDGVPDSAEEEFGSNSKDSSDVSEVIVENTTFYLIDTDGDGVFDEMYLNDETEVSIAEKDGKYLLDTNGDGVWDYEYDASLGEIEEYEEKSEPTGGIPWLFIIIGLIGAAITVLLVLIKMGYIIIDVH